MSGKVEANRSQPAWTTVPRTSSPHEGGRFLLPPVPPEPAPSVQTSTSRFGVGVASSSGGRSGVGRFRARRRELGASRATVLALEVRRCRVLAEVRQSRAWRGARTMRTGSGVPPSIIASRSRTASPSTRSPVGRVGREARRRRTRSVSAGLAPQTPSPSEVSRPRANEFDESREEREPARPEPDDPRIARASTESAIDKTSVAVMIPIQMKQTSGPLE